LLKVLQAIALIVGFASLTLLPAKAFSTEAYRPEVSRDFLVKQRVLPFYYPVFVPTKTCELQPFQKNPKELADYKMWINQILVNAWDSSLQFPKAQPMVKLTINDQGRLIKSKLVHSSKNADLDHQLLASLNSAFPLPVAPGSGKATNQEFIYILTPQIVELYKLHGSPSDPYIDKLASDYMPIALKWMERAMGKITARLIYPPPIDQEFDVHVVVTADGKTGEVLVYKIVKASCYPAFDDSIKKAFRSIHFLPKPKEPSPLGLIKAEFAFTHHKPKPTTIP